MTYSIIITFVDGKQNAEIESMCQEYLKRLPWKITLNRIAPSKYSEIPAAKKAETDSILAKISKSDEVILLTEHAKQHNSLDFKEFLKTLIDAPKNLHFIIAGAYGFDDSIFKIPHLKLSLSNLTFPHKIAKLLLIEQIYRSYMLINNKQYHY